MAVGLALALSSTAIVMQLLIESKRATRPTGRASLGVLLFQDILVAPILILVGFMGRGDDGALGQLILTAAIQGAVAIAVILGIGRFLLRRVFRLAAERGGRDFLLALCLLTVVGAAVITASAGLSLALGAFLAGLLLGETEFKHQAEIDLEPFKGLLLGLFFTTVGVNLNLALIAEQWPLVLGGLIGLLFIKLAIALPAIWWIVKDRGVAIRSAFLLASAGEFAFVIIGAASAAAIVSPETASIVAAIAGASMLLTPVLGMLGEKVADMVAKPHGHVSFASPEEELTTKTGHVIIGGFGRVGQAAARVLANEETDIVALDCNAGRVRAERNNPAARVYFGDAARPEMLERMGAEEASLFLVTVDDPQAAEAMVRAMRAMRPAAPILARAADIDHARILREAGASYVIPDAIEAGLQMAGRALEEFGYSPAALGDRIAQERDEAYSRAVAANEKSAS